MIYYDNPIKPKSYKDLERIKRRLNVANSVPIYNKNFYSQSLDDRRYLEDQHLKFGNDYDKYDLPDKFYYDVKENNLTRVPNFPGHLYTDDKGNMVYYKFSPYDNKTYNYDKLYIHTPQSFSDRVKKLGYAYDDVKDIPFLVYDKSANNIFEKHIDKKYFYTPNAELTDYNTYNNFHILSSDGKPVSRQDVDIPVEDPYKIYRDRIAKEKRDKEVGQLFYRSVFDDDPTTLEEQKNREELINSLYSYDDPKRPISYTPQIFNPVKNTPVNKEEEVKESQIEAEEPKENSNKTIPDISDIFERATNPFYGLYKPFIDKAKELNKSNTTENSTESEDSKEGDKKDEEQKKEIKDPFANIKKSVNKDNAQTNNTNNNSGAIGKTTPQKEVVKRKTKVSYRTGNGDIEYNTPYDKARIILESIPGALNIMDTYNKQLGILQQSKSNPHENYYKTYGEKALEKIEDAKGGLKTLLNDIRRDAMKRRNVANAQASMNSSSINTYRALALSNESKNIEADSQAYTNYSNKLTELQMKEAELNNQIEDARAKGEATARDLNDKDLQTYYSSLANIEAQNSKNWQEWYNTFFKKLENERTLQRNFEKEERGRILTEEYYKQLSDKNGIGGKTSGGSTKTFATFNGNEFTMPHKQQIAFQKVMSELGGSEDPLFLNNNSFIYNGKYMVYNEALNRFVIDRNTYDFLKNSMDFGKFYEQEGVQNIPYKYILNKILFNKINPTEEELSSAEKLKFKDYKYGNKIFSILTNVNGVVKNKVVTLDSAVQYFIQNLKQNGYSSEDLLMLSAQDIDKLLQDSDLVDLKELKSVKDTIDGIAIEKTNNKDIFTSLKQNFKDSEEHEVNINVSSKSKEILKNVFGDRTITDIIISLFNGNKEDFKKSVTNETVAKIISDYLKYFFKGIKGEEIVNQKDFNDLNKSFEGFNSDNNEDFKTIIYILNRK